MTSTTAKFDGFSDDERAAMKDHAQELKKAARRSNNAAEWEQDLLGKIAEMKDSDRVLAERIHAIVTANAPSLTPKLWYGMPSYNNAEGKSVIFFQPAEKFKARYATLGFQDSARLDDGALWPTSYALTELSAADEARIAALVKQAAG
ncbi:DUF1801 domain-containing protein [Nonomuraea sp. NBC_01738]|uniref:iron chaperone n=1 Tax=Nonomuraea sp. NBC_01738 TaxID=2976003 RepID=UPI002E0D2953|nr:DUF1801 domain-containing protein [Nonomuraea sp. NBC_01738]